jgi:hypothetical protein
MAFVNYATKNLAIKVVYYGPGLSGKTTNLRFIYFKLDASYRGEFICLETETERTFFFDLLPIKAGLIGEFKVHFQLMTVPGQAFYEASRKSVLKGADGIIFVADSQIPLLDANLENFDGLRRNCLEHNIDLNVIPLVFQYNKRDLNYLIPVETFNNLLNPRRLPFVEAAAINGVGVFESLREISKLTVPVVREKLLGEKRKETGKIEFPEERVEEAAERREMHKDDVEFVNPAQASPFQVTKIKMKSQKEIEQELEKISKEFGTKAK